MTYYFERNTFNDKNRPPVKVGDKWNFLTIDQVYKCSNGRKKVKATCDCGRHREAYETHIRSGSTRSCGCLVVKTGREAINNWNRSKVLMSEDTRLKQALYNHYKHTAKKAETTFELNMAQFIGLVTSSCHYCGKPPSNEYKIGPKAGRRRIENTLKYSGIDRISPPLGYTLGNCSPCCIECNQAKSDMAIEDFRNHVVRIYLHWATHTCS
jgi:hypothetical protein